MTPKKPSPSSRLPRRYTVYRTLNLVGLIYISLAGWARMGLAVGMRGLLAEIQTSPGPLYMGLGGALWGLLGLGGGVLLFLRGRMARLAGVACALVLALSYWIDRLFFVRSADAQANWPFALALTLVLLAYSTSLALVLNRWEEKQDAAGK